MLNQFHDILPGSSIRQVYDDSRADYARVQAIGQKVVDDALAFLLGRIQIPEPAYVVFNSMSTPRGGLIELPWTDETLKSANGELAPVAQGNVLQAFEDKPLAFGAGNIDIYYQEKRREIQELVEAVVEEQGPLRGVLRLTWRYEDSTITERVTLYRHSPRIDFRTEVDWHRQQTLLKVAFPVDVRATHATYDLQFGSIERSNHWNTSWDYARFEVCGHKWADLSEGNYGMALLNDCKYGYDVKDNVLRLTLLKSAIRPDATADQGKHEFTYSLLPHARDWREGGVVEEGYDLNYPLHYAAVRSQPHGTLPACQQFVSVDADNVTGETVKLAEPSPANRLAIGGEQSDLEESQSAWIVRVYEFKQYRRGEVNLRFGRPIRKAVECNLMEEEKRAIDYQADRLTFSIAPFEIKTFRVWFG